MGKFVANVSAHAGGGMRILTEFRKVLAEIGISIREDASGAMLADYTPGSYDPIPVKFSFPDGMGILAIEGVLLDLGELASDELREAINFLNVEVGTFRFYVKPGRGAEGDLIHVRQDLLPNLDQEPAIHARELRQALTSLCAQKAIFDDTLQQIQRGRSWRLVKDALRALR